MPGWTPSSAPTVPPSSSERSEIAAGGVVYRRAGDRIEVLVGEQRDRLSGARNLRLPKGKIDPGETPEDAAVREVGEETGISARVVAELGAGAYTYRESDARVSKQVFFFLLEAAGGEARARDGEMDRVHWCPIDEAGERLTFQVERDAVARARAHLAAGPRR